MSDLMAHVSSPAEILTRHGRCGGLIVSSFVSGKGRPSSSPCRGHCVVFLGKTLYSQSAGLSPPRCINGCDGLASHPGEREAGRLEIFLLSLHATDTGISSDQVGHLTVCRLYLPTVYQRHLTCYTSQLKYVFRLEENVSRVMGQN